MYAIVKNVANPPRISRAGVEPRLVIWKNESSAPREVAVSLDLVVGGMAHSVEQPGQPEGLWALGRPQSFSMSLDP